MLLLALPRHVLRREVAHLCGIDALHAHAMRVGRLQARARQGSASCGRTRHLRVIPDNSRSSACPARDSSAAGPSRPAAGQLHIAAAGAAAHQGRRRGGRDKAGGLALHAHKLLARGILGLRQPDGRQQALEGRRRPAQPRHQRRRCCRLVRLLLACACLHCLPPPLQSVPCHAGMASLRPAPSHSLPGLVEAAAVVPLLPRLQPLQLRHAALRRLRVYSGGRGQVATGREQTVAACTPWGRPSAGPGHSWQVRKSPTTLFPPPASRIPPRLCCHSHISALARLYALRSCSTGEVRGQQVWECIGAQAERTHRRPGVLSAPPAGAKARALLAWLQPACAALCCGAVHPSLTSSCWKPRCWQPCRTFSYWICSSRCVIMHLRQITSSPLRTHDARCTARAQMLV